MKTLVCFFITALGLTLLALAGIGVKGTVEQLSQTHELRNPPATNYIELQEVVIRSTGLEDENDR